MMCVYTTLYLFAHVNPSKVLGHDALRMRLRRLTQVKPSGKCYVDEQTRADYTNMERREWLEVALLESIRKHGSDRRFFKKVRVWNLIS